ETDGSFNEHKESAIVWHHQEADPYFGSCEAKELLDHLENVLTNEPVVVKMGQHIVEMKPQVHNDKGVSMGIVVENLISSLRSEDEDVFEIIARSVSNLALPIISQVFACTVGQKPSMAKYYLKETSEVIKIV
ncbi:hypothetical protein HN51_001693, partial [Arachis hypogaea]